MINIAFFSSDESFEELYKTLKKNGIYSKILITEKPKLAGRGLKTNSNAANLSAQKYKIPVLFSDQTTANKIKAIIDEERISLGFVFSFGQKISAEIIKLFPLGIINLHPSLLPKFRGPSPIQSTIISGGNTGFTIIKINNDIDAGDILFQKEIIISKNDDYISLKKKILDRAISKLPTIIKKYAQGNIRGRPQDEKKASSTKLIKKSDGEITSWDSAETGLRKIRAYAAWPKAYLIAGKKRLIIHQAKIENEKLSIVLIQPEGKKPMSFSEFKRGYGNLLTDFPDFVKI